MYPLKFWRSLKLRTKLVLITTLPMAGVVTIALATAAMLEIRQTKQLIVQKTAASVAAMSQDFERIRLLNDQETAINLVDRIQSLGEIERLYVADTDGRELFAWQDPALALLTPGEMVAIAGPPGDEAATFADGLMHMSRTLHSDGRAIGTAYITVSTRQLDEGFQRAMLVIMFSGVTITLLGIALALFLQRFISRDIVELSRTAQRVTATNDFTLRAVRRCDDEIGSLITSFNVMMEHIQVGDRDLRSAREELEDRVRRRTAKLAQANEQLMKEMQERKRLESELVQAEKLESIGQLAAGIAHEINTPTQYVSDNVRFLRDQLANLLTVVDHYDRQLDPSARQKAWDARVAETRTALEKLDFEFLRTEIPQAIEQSLEGLERVSTIVRAMKDFSHPGSQEKQPADLNKAIESTITVCRHRWKLVADVELDLAADLPLTTCLIGEFNQVILNMVVNAADAIAEGNAATGAAKGTIRISTRSAGDFAEIRVHDTGCGMPDSVRNRIFDPFFTTKQVGKGSGQGLTISRNVIVEKHGGTIECLSKVGEGTTFIIRLPVHAARTAVREAA